MPGKGKPFKKGNTAGVGKGRPKLTKAAKAIRKLTSEQYILLLNEWLTLNPEQVKKKLSDPKISTLDMMVGKVIVEAIKRGDATRLDYFINRLIGKVTEHVSVETYSDFLQRKADEGK